MLWKWFVYIIFSVFVSKNDFHWNHQVLSERVIDVDSIMSCTKLSHFCRLICKMVTLGLISKGAHFFYGMRSTCLPILIFILYFMIYRLHNIVRRKNIFYIYAIAECQNVSLSYLLFVSHLLIFFKLLFSGRCERFVAHR